MPSREAHVRLLVRLLRPAMALASEERLTAVNMVIVPSQHRLGIGKHKSPAVVLNSFLTLTSQTSP